MENPDSEKIRRKWIDEELIVAFNLYCKTPFGRITQHNPNIIELAKILHRTPSSVGLKLSNFASFDPELKARGIKGLKNAAKKDGEIFERFNADRETLAFESEQLLARFEGKIIEDKFIEDLPGIHDFAGTEKERYVKTRVNQSFFRDMILANYEGKCALTGIDIKPMLIASHIIPWKEDVQHRLDPSNGICLSAHFDKAFDKGLISFDMNYKLMLSSFIINNRNKNYYAFWFNQFEGLQLTMPSKYLPNHDFLKWHNQNVFEK